jgi:very-short-patch-repair endonuclease
MTPAEKHLWAKLNQLSPIFQAQVVLYGYIADFCSFRHKMVIEIDGEIHESRREYDARRDEHLERHRFRTLCFTNDEVLKDRAGVLGRIMERL